MGDSDTDFGVLHRFTVLLGLAQNGTQLQLELTLHMQLLNPLRNTNILKEIVLFNDLNSFFQINDAFFKHSKFLETHSHVAVSDVGKILVSLAMIQVDHFQDTLGFL